ncbi:MAG: hypothetical protein JWQ39_1200 [Glaciihabitans sp.]|nr:hypothetical protein [Glaciihabitans sp.]
MIWPSDRLTLFGLPTIMAADFGAELRKDLRDLWNQQLSTAPTKFRESAANQQSPPSQRALLDDLQGMKHWFDPVASSKRLTQVILDAPAVPIELSRLPEISHLVLGKDKALLTLEGRAILWVLDRNAQDPWAAGAGGTDVLLAADDCFAAVSSVQSVYRAWSLNKLISVSDLMDAETSTLRPSAAGLLFFLLLNRHTSSDRALPVPEDAALSEQVSEAISGPVIAFARGLSLTNRATDRGVELYRGWALGEIRRRLGSDLHQEGGRVWIAHDGIERATERLKDSSVNRVGETNSLDLALANAVREYESARPRLAALGIAHERPANTARLVESLLATDASPPSTNGGDP